MLLVDAWMELLEFVILKVVVNRPPPPSFFLAETKSQCAIGVDQLNAEACKAVHIGDDQKADKVGANAIGVDCW